MSKLGCSCGHVISDVQVPNEVTGTLLSDKDGHDFFDFIDAATSDLLQHLESNNLAAWRAKHFNDIYPTNVSPSEMLADVIHSRFLDCTLALMECDACGRLYIQRAPGVNRYRGYEPERDDGGTPHVLGPVARKEEPASRE